MLRPTWLAASMIVSGALACSARGPESAGEAERAVLEAYVHAWNTHDSIAFDTILAPAGVHEDIALGFRGEGPAQVRGFLRQIIAQEPDFRWHLTAVYPRDSVVAAEWTWAGTYTGPGPNGPLVNAPDSGRGASVAVIRHGRIERFTDYHDVASFFAPAASVH
ncbi:MAG TPA: nuclear transport factor 2 family protein [Gemmatimonadales bacterium]|nr:nuclear transport factor 2 family protein [Gemmatimonadales bacterium]